jgi:hypothetical protein
MDMRPAADWIQTILSPTICAGSTCPLFQVPGLGTVCVARDYMHCMFLGWLQYLYGSVFYMIVYQLIEEEPLENLHEIWTFIKEYQSRARCVHKYQQRLDKLSMFVKKPVILS